MISISNRIWPQELEIYADNPKAFPCESGPFPRLCENCGGNEMMMVYVIQDGPFQAPKGKAKWLELDSYQGNPMRPSVSGWYSGELKTAPCPVCQGGRMQAWLTRNCGLEGHDLTLSLRDFRVAGSLSDKAEALAIAQGLLAQNRHPSGFITFYGDYGVGKSHLLKGITNGFRAINVRVHYALLSDLLAEIRERFSDDHGSVAVEEAIEQYRKVPVLCLDEIADPDRANLTGWAKETTFRLLEARHNDLAGCLTVLATNANPDDLAPEWGYLRSRMTSGQRVLVGGADMRPFNGQRRETAVNLQSSTQQPEPVYQTYPVAAAIDQVASQHEIPL